jgi:hypothetical protein
LDILSQTEVPNLNAALLNGLAGSHYLDYNNLDNKPTITPGTTWTTIGTGGEFLTIKAAVDAGRNFLFQVGAITENVANVISGKRIFVQGNGVDLITVSATISASSTANIVFQDCIITSSTVIMFSGATLGAFFDRCNLSLTNVFLASANIRRLRFDSCNITTTPTGQINILFEGANLVVNNAANAVFNFNYLENATFSNTCNLRNYGVASRLSYGGSCNLQPYAAQCVFINCDLGQGNPVANGTNRTTLIGCTLGNLGTGYITAIGTTFNWGGTFNPAFFKGVGCRWGTAITITNMELIGCDSVGFTITGNNTRIVGGNHAALAVNGSKNQITGVVATSITVAAGQTKNRITENITTNAIVETGAPLNYYAGNFLA